MGLLVEGQWVDQWYDTKKTGGKFVREDAQFRHLITSDGTTDIEGKQAFKAEAGRYHLYVSYACPWAHRTIIFRQLKGLEDIITMSSVHPDMLENGWYYADADTETGTDDIINGFKYHHQVYTATNPNYTGRVTVPVLWDKKTKQIVNNESSEIIRIFNTAFNHITGNTDDYYPEILQDEIDAINDVIYHNVNNGVYKTGFATDQKVYEEALNTLFNTLDDLEQRLSTQRYLVGQQVTEADWRLFTTLIRFDAVYFSHFKTNLKTIEDYPHLSAYLRDLYQVTNVSKTVNIDDIKRHYYVSQTTINPTQVIPVGPFIDYTTQHDRDQLS